MRWDAGLWISMFTVAQSTCHRMNKFAFLLSQFHERADECSYDARMLALSLTSGAAAGELPGRVSAWDERDGTPRGSESIREDVCRKSIVCVRDGPSCPGVYMDAVRMRLRQRRRMRR